MIKNPFVNQKLFRLHSLIKMKSTGTAEQLARKLSCSKRTVYNKLDQLKERNLPVRWDEARQSYCYEGEVELKFSYILNGKEMECITGGVNQTLFINESLASSANKLHSWM